MRCEQGTRGVLLSHGRSTELPRAQARLNTRSGGFRVRMDPRKQESQGAGADLGEEWG